MTNCRQFLLLTIAASGIAAACGSGQYTDPEGRTGEPALSAICDAITQSALKCRASVYCSGDYPCTGALPSDLTASATWTVDDSSVAQIVAPGTVVAVGIGNTIVRVQTPGYLSSFHNIGVFAGTVPLPTFSLVGYVYSGSSVSTGGITGATVDVTSGLIAGVHAVTNAAPVPVEG
jgi:hypothetical protein